MLCSNRNSPEYLEANEIFWWLYKKIQSRASDLFAIHRSRNHRPSICLDNIPTGFLLIVSLRDILCGGCTDADRRSLSRRLADLRYGRSVAVDSRGLWQRDKLITRSSHDARVTTILTRQRFNYRFRHGFIWSPRRRPRGSVNYARPMGWHRKFLFCGKLGIDLVQKYILVLNSQFNVWIES